jgi:hypothetical protein
MIDYQQCKEEFMRSAARSARPVIPDYDDLPLVGGLRCSWGLWGDDDRFGTLNLLGPALAAQAAAGVERGASFSLNWPMTLPDPPLFGRPPLRHEIVRSPTSPSLNDLVHDWNPQASSQWDGFRHVSRHGHRNYNGLADDQHGVHFWAERGIVGGAVLLDVARWRESVGRPLRHGEPDPISPSDLLDTAAAQGVEVHEGDILLVHTGWIEWYEGLDAGRRAEIAPPPALANPGLEPSEDMARTLWNLRPAAVACDNPAVEVWPQGALLPPETVAEIKADPARRHEMVLHVRLIPMLGLVLGELWNLAELAADCAADGRYRTLLVSAPANLPFAAATPANAIAVK